MTPHPLSTLSVEETRRARDIILAVHHDVVVDFREIYLQEPVKEELKKYLDLEHSARLSPTSPRPPRLAKCQYDIIGADKILEYHESIVDINLKRCVKHEAVGKQHHAALTLWEFETLVNVCKASPLFQAAIAEFKLPEGFKVVVEPWPYGGLDLGEENRRYFQGLCFAQNTRSKSPDSNFYAYPLPLIPIMDAHKKEIIRIDKLATGGKGDGLTEKTHSERIIDH